MQGRPFPPVCQVLGCYIGAVRLTDCRPHTGEKLSSRWHFRAFEGFYLADAVVFANPVPARGMQKIFDVSPADEAMVREQMAQARARELRRVGA